MRRTLHSIVPNWHMAIGRLTFIIGLSLLLLSFANLVTAENPVKQQPDNTTQKQKKTNKQKWPKPFNPSEKISADQAVAFPVDI